MTRQGSGIVTSMPLSASDVTDTASFHVSRLVGSISQSKTCHGYSQYVTTDRQKRHGTLCQGRVRRGPNPDQPSVRKMFLLTYITWHVCCVWCAVCGVWCAVCSVRYAVCRVWCAVCGVLCAVCGGWCAMRGQQKKSTYIYVQIVYLSS